MIKTKVDIVRAIPLPPISLKKGPVPICPPSKKVKNFFDKIGSTIEIRNEKLSINFWSISGKNSLKLKPRRTKSPRTKFPKCDNPKEYSRIKFPMTKSSMT